MKSCQLVTVFRHFSPMSMEALHDAGRDDELMRALLDPDRYRELLEEFGLQPQT